MQTSKSFRAYDLGQTLLLPPDMNDWLPNDHLARFVAETVSVIDLKAFFASYEDGRGLSAYHPQMMLSVLVYGYCVGVRSSRKLAVACQENVAFRYLSGNKMPSHSAFANFRRRHLGAMHDLFVQVFELCREAGLVNLGHVGIDGSKFKANASKHKAVSWGRLEERQKYYRDVAESLTAEAESADTKEDEEHGDDHDGGCLPEDLRRAKGRLEKLQEAKAALEERAKKRSEKAQASAEERRKAIADKERETGRKQCGRKPVIPDPAKATPKEKDQHNFTDHDSRIMLDGATKGYKYAYNAQIGVDGDSGVIVGTYLTQNANDKSELLPAVEAIATITDGQLPAKISADNGYYSDSAITDPRLKDIDLYIPPDGSRKRRGTPGDAGAEGNGEHLPPRKPSAPSQAMREKLRTEEGRDVYKMRKAIAEAPFGIIKSVMGFREFSLRGKEKVDGEWNLVTACFNIRKLLKATII